MQQDGVAPPKMIEELPPIVTLRHGLIKSITYRAQFHGNVGSIFERAVTVLQDRTKLPLQAGTQVNRREALSNDPIIPGRVTAEETENGVLLQYHRDFGAYIASRPPWVIIACAFAACVILLCTQLTASWKTTSMPFFGLLIFVGFAFVIAMISIALQQKFINRTWRTHEDGHWARMLGKVQHQELDWE